MFKDVIMDVIKICVIAIVATFIILGIHYTIKTINESTELHYAQTHDLNNKYMYVSVLDPYPLVVVDNQPTYTTNDMGVIIKHDSTGMHSYSPTFITKLCNSDNGNDRAVGIWLRNYYNALMRRDM
jgi:hypothetical protein